MENKKTSRILCLAIIITIFMTMMIGCGTQTNSINESSSTEVVENTSVNNEQASSDGQEVSIDPFGKYDSTIELTYAMTYAGNQEFQKGDSYDNNMWTRAYEEKLGIKIKAKWIAEDFEQGNTKTQIMIATNDLPDFFIVKQTDLISLAENDRLESLDNYYKYLSDDIKYNLGYSDITLKSAIVNEKLMGLPSPKEPAANFLKIRLDWLKKLNLQPPKNVDEVMNIARAFAKNDPDGNNKDDTYGFGLSKDLTVFIGNGTFTSYNAYPTLWVKGADGQLAFGGIQPQVKEALKALQDMYKEKIIDPEFMTKDVWTVLNEISASKIGMYYGPYWMNPDYTVALAPADHINLQIPTKDGSIGKSPVSIRPDDYWVVRKGVKNPEAVMKIANLSYELYMSDRSLPEYKNFKRDDGSDAQVPIPPCLLTRLFVNPQNALKVTQAVKDGKSDGLSAGQLGIYDNILKAQQGDRAALWDYKVFFEGGTSFMTNDLIKDNLFAYDANNAPAGPEQIKYSQNLGAMMQEVFTRIIVGEDSIDAFDKFVQDWKKLGGDAMTIEVNELNK